ncbi:hypothetical protein CARUB_v10008295mg [Capsella rubella]|uniref:Aminotransferase-like plant mobile domain-containing protein n=1 Tax=Capsella rubella TaxID=81985 RepID=R0GV19_9BRAS|nr:uncharacterized protein LOC17897325 [Capsella rubella]EOA39656.1 hypothetical protein CARUB_v10008295mg [Capsella rubella]
MASPSSQVFKHELLDEVHGAEAQEPSAVGETQRPTSSALVGRSSRKKTQLFKPCFIGESEAMLPRQSRSAPFPQSKALPLSVSFHGWRFASKDFKLWAKKMSDVHQHTWRKAGIFDAIMASLIKIPKNIDLVLGIAEKWCCETKTFVFPWGEATITLEDVMVLLGFSVLGLPVFATLDMSGRETMAKLEKECLRIKKDKGFSANQVAWIERFMESGDELEHVAFIVSWLSYFVFPSRYYQHSEHIFPIAVHLSRGTRVALAPAVLAHLYAELSLLRNHIRDFKESTFNLKIYLTALFKLVQVWTWERFWQLQPTPNLMQKGEPRLARWQNLKQDTSDARKIFKNSKRDSFELRPYTQHVGNWKFPQFYPEKAMWIPVDPNLDDDFISFARCFKVSELVGIYCVENYFPNRVALQLGMLQDVPSPANRHNLSQDAAWNDYNKPIDDVTIYIPSRFAPPQVTQMFCEWRRKWFLEFQCSSEVSRVVKSDLKLEDENNVGRCQAQVPSDKDKEDDSHTIASEPPSKKIRLEADNNDLGPCQKLASIRDNGEKTFPPLEKEQRNEETDEAGINAEKRMVLSPFNETNLSDHPVSFDEAMDIVEVAPETRQFCDDRLDVQTDETGNKTGKFPSQFDDNSSSDSSLGVGTNRGVVDIIVSPLETRETRDDELDVHGSYAEKIDMISNGSKEPDCWLKEDSILAGEKATSDEKLCSSEAEKEDDVAGDDSLIQKKNLAIIEELALNVDKNGSSPHQNLACGDETSLSPCGDQSNVHIGVGEGSHGQDCLLHENALGSEKRNNGFDFEADKNSAKKRIQELTMLLLSIEERILKAQEDVALIIERRDAELRRIAARYN